MVSLLMAQGHPQARHYPVSMLWTETRIARRRVNKELADTATLTQMAITAMFSKDGRDAFNKRIKDLTGD